MYENGTNIENTPECNECKNYERELAQLRAEVEIIKSMIQAEEQHD